VAEAAPVSAWQSVLTAAVTVAALALMAVAFRAWSLARTKRVLLLALGFSSLAAKGLFLTLVLFAAPSWSGTALAASLAFDAIALALFAGAVLRSSPSSGSRSPGRRSATASSSSAPADASTPRS
jgi:hypothetical protein